MPEAGGGKHRVIRRQGHDVTCPSQVISNDRKKPIELKVSEDDDLTAYLYLPEHPGMVPGCVERTVRLHELVEGYTGADILLDFAENNVLIGIEILADED